MSSLDTASPDESGGFVSDVLIPNLWVIVGVGAAVLIIVIVVTVWLVRRRRASGGYFTDTESKLGNMDPASAISRSGSELNKVVPLSQVDMTAELPKDFNLSPADYIISNRQNHSPSSDIFVAEPQSQKASRFGRPVVVKRPLGVYDSLELIKQEAFVVNHMQDSKYVASVIGYHEMPNTIIYRSYPLGDMHNWFHQKRFGRFQTKRQHFAFVRNLAGLLSDFSKAGIVYRAVEPKNMMIEQDTDTLFKCRAAEFGFVYLVGVSGGPKLHVSYRNTSGAAAPYRAPEAWEHSKSKSDTETIAYSEDTFAFAMMIYHLVCRREAWSVGVDPQQ